MDKEKLSQMTDSMKLNYLIEKIDRIDRKVNPPRWKRILWWCQSHWVILLALFGIFYTLINFWHEIQLLISFVQKMNESIEGLKGFGSSVGEGIGNTKEAFVDSVKDWFQSP